MALEIENRYAQELEAVWDEIPWSRKFENSKPNQYSKIFSANRLEDIDAAREYFASTPENDQTYWRAAHLGRWSSGEFIVVVEEEWDEDF